MEIVRDIKGRSLAVGRIEPRRAAESAAEVVHRKLRQEILSLARPPGASISEKDIAAAHCVSRTPVREALLRLSEERLVDITAKSGTSVARIPIVVLADSLCAREALEIMLIGKAALRARPSDVTAMRAIVQRQLECVDAHDASGFHDNDEALHFAIAEAAGHPGVWTMVQQIKIQLDRLRRLTLPQFDWLRRVIHEHEALVEAIASRAPDRAAAAMQAHFHSLKGVLDEVHTMNPDFFIGEVDDFVL